MTRAARYILVGGFLGAGKTTALLRLAGVLKTDGLKVGLITNDQSTGLVDTAMAVAQGVAVEEITGGCFCCRFDSLTAAAEKLAADARPDVFLAEPVGSCTDLTATVTYPLRRLYGDNFSIAPYSVLVDPVRAERVLGLEPGAAFSPKVVYIYEKQLEEAEIIVVNKLDTLDPARRERLTAALETRFPRADVIALSARTGDGFAAWADKLRASDLGTAPAMDVDYDTYADGEALLGWLNATVTLTAADAPIHGAADDAGRGGEFDGNAYLMALAERLRDGLASRGEEIAHLKMTLSSDTGSDLAVVNLTRTDAAPEAAHTLAEPLASGELVLNLRAEADPAELRVLVETALAAAAPATAVLDHIEAFRPGRPVPTHRQTTA